MFSLSRSLFHKHEEEGKETSLVRTVCLLACPSLYFYNTHVQIMTQIKYSIHHEHVLYWGTGFWQFGWLVSLKLYSCHWRQVEACFQTSGHYYFYGTDRNGMERFRHIILRNGTGSNAHMTAKNVACASKCASYWPDAVWTVSKNILKCWIDKLYGHLV